MSGAVVPKLPEGAAGRSFICHRPAVAHRHKDSWALSELGFRLLLSFPPFDFLRYAFLLSLV
jgi:hypothetical protein